MSTPDRVRRDGDDGFSLVEIVVAMGLLAAVMMAALPMLLSMLRASETTRMQTQGKNLAQERLEQIRGLRFHVDRQNGQFLDLLDIYYSNATEGASPLPVAVGNDTLTGRYVASGGGTNGEPPAPYYRVTTGALAGTSGFHQVITAQFLEADGKTPVPAVRYQNVYNSQTVGRDAPPTLMVGITVITSWTEAGQAKSYRTYTQVTEGRPEAPIIQSQGRATAVEVSSTAADGSTLALQGGAATLDGAQSSGSSVSGFVSGALARRSGQDPVLGSTSKFLLPSETVTTEGASAHVNPGSCSWYSFGQTSTDNVSGSVADGLPKAPANVDLATPSNVATGRLDATGTGGCPLLGFDNLTGGGVQVSSGAEVGSRLGNAPFVAVADGTPGTGAVQGSAYVTATPLAATGQQTRSGARASMDRPVVLFPGSPDNPPSATSEGGLVSARLSSAQVDCVSGADNTTPGTVRGQYTLVLRWWGRATGETAPRWRQATYTYDSAAGTPLTVTGDSWDPAAVFLANGQPLSSVVFGDGPAGVTTGATSGARGFSDGILTLTTAPTLQNESDTDHSSIKVKLGLLSCVSDDQR